MYAREGHFKVICPFCKFGFNFDNFDVLDDEVFIYQIIDYFLIYNSYLVCN